MPNYTKLFNSIITSTIWTEDDRTRIVWITMLALSDQNGEIHASIPGLAKVAGVSIEDTEAAVNKFLSPDKYSRTPDHEGRRIVEIDGGWELLNHAKYRKMASREDAKEAAAERQRRKRERGDSVTVKRDSHALSRSVTPCHGASRSVTKKLHIAEAEAEAEAKTHTQEESVCVDEPVHAVIAGPLAFLARKIDQLTEAWTADGSDWQSYATQQALHEKAEAIQKMENDDWRVLRWHYLEAEQSDKIKVSYDRQSFLKKLTANLARAKKDWKTSGSPSLNRIKKAAA